MKLQTKQGLKPVRGVLFDKDGTLIDSEKFWVQPTIEVVEQVLEHAHAKDTTMTQEKMLAILGVVDGVVLPNSTIASGTAMDMLEVMAEYYEINVEQTYQEVLQYFKTYIHTHPEEILPIGDIHTLIRSLKEEGIRVGVVTNDSRIPTQAIFETVGLWESFDFVGTTDDYAKKPSTDSLQAFANQFQLTLDEIFYVGDSYVDMEYATTCGSIAVLTGGSSSEKMEELAMLVLNSVDELPQFLVKGES